MRRRLVLVVLATTSLVVVAFALPLAALVRSVARDRAVTAAQADSTSLAPVLVTGAPTATIDLAVWQTDTGADRRLVVWPPGGRAIGGDKTPADRNALDLARRGTSFAREHDGGMDLYTAVANGKNQVYVIRARVPDALLNKGVHTAWLALAGVALVLVLAAAVIADRLARSMTRDATELAGTAQALATGQGDARADPGPTPELAEAARALNLLADRIDELRAAERERVADLSHRLRTPLTALRLDAEAAGDATLVADVERLETAISELIHSARRPLHAGVVAATCDLAAVADERARFWSALAEDDGRTWNIDVAPTPCPVRLSADEAAAAIDALVGNVFAHTPEGTPYDLRVFAAAGEVCLVVEDAGPGIEAPHVAVGRGSTRVGSGSTGLGLDIARQAADAAGGTLVIGRSTSGGAQVCLALPELNGRQRPGAAAAAT